MAKKDKKKSAEQKAQKAAKQAKKVEKKEKKHKAKGRDEDSDADDVDLDAVLAAYAEEQAKFLKVTENASEPPTPRASSTLIGNPSNRNELFLFGGEFYDGALATFYNNLYTYLIDRNEWREITSPNTPLPRSGHAWCRGGNSGGVYLFGGEFSSPKQGTFYHYNDFWRLEPSSREWERLETKKGPPARSGHRMTYFKNYIILFGGFQDTSQQTKYLQDLWIYDCTKFVWYNPTLPPASQKPDARSSFSLLPHESGAVLYGGYSRVKTNVAVGKQGKGGGAQKQILKPLVHQDTWFLRITPPPSDAAATVSPTVRWERRKRPANPPNPTRAGATMAYHKGRGIMFGGVHDVEESEEGIESEFFNQLFAWNTDRNRFFPLVLRKPRTGGKKQVTQAPRRNRGKADEEELLKNLAELEAKSKGMRVEDLDERELGSGAANEEAEDDSSKPVLAPPKFELPHNRFNAQLAVQDDSLFVFGGTFERGDQEFTFNDMYSIDLGKLDGVRENFFREPHNWNVTLDESEDDEDDEDEDDYEGSDEEGSTAATESTAPTEVTEPATPAATAPAEEEAEEADVDEPKDPRPSPRPFEPLREFFNRTSTEWQNLLLEALKYKPLSESEGSIKELRKKAFDMAEEKWWDAREEIRALEDEQEEAGIGEVTSLADRATAGAGAGRRR